MSSGQFPVEAVAVSDPDLAPSSQNSDENMEAGSSMDDSSFSGDSDNEGNSVKEEGQGGLQWHLYDNVDHLPEEQRVERVRNLTERKVWSCPVQGCGRRYWCAFALRSPLNYPFPVLSLCSSPSGPAPACFPLSIRCILFRRRIYLY
jgi:hypothetical protein